MPDSAATTTEVTCPQCGTLAMLEEGEHVFCTNCDYPLFWAGRNEPRAEAPTGMVAGGGEIEDDAKATDIICRTCAERNPGTRAFCIKCGSELTRPEEDFDPEAPPSIYLAQPESTRTSKIGRAIASVIALVLVVAGSFYGYQRWDDTRVPPVAFVMLDATGDTGYDTAIAVGEGAPVIAYRDAGGKALRLVRCELDNCHGTPKKTALVTQGDPGHDILLDLQGGSPFVIYRDNATRSLRIVQCGTFACDNAEGTRRFATVDAADDPGYDSSVAVGGGIAIVTYRAALTGQLRAALLCRNECSDDDGQVVERGSANGRAIVNIAGGPNTDTGYDSAVAIPLGGTPYIAFRDAKNPSLQLLRCLNRSCSQRSSPTALGFGDVGHDTVMLIGQNAFPVIAARDGEKNVVMLYACGDVDCTSAARTETVVDDGGPDKHAVGYNLAMVLSPAGNPILLYRNETEKAMKILRCGDPTCSVDKRTIEKVDNSVGVDDGYDISAKMAGGLLHVAYRDGSSKHLKFSRIKP